MYNLYNCFCHINKCQMYTFNSSNIHKKAKHSKVMAHNGIWKWSSFSLPVLQLKRTMSGL